LDLGVSFKLFKKYFSLKL